MLAQTFTRRQVLYIGYDPDDTTDPVLEELASLLSSNCFSFKLDLTNELSEHPVYSGLADFGSLEEPDDE